MIAGTTPKFHLRSRPTCHIPIIIRPTQRNRMNCMRLTSKKVHLSKTIHDWHCPLRILPYRAIIYASFSKRAPMTFTWSNFVNNTLIAYIYMYQRVYIRLPRRDQGIVYLFVGPRYRHWGAFAKRCINNRTKRRERCQSCIVLERWTFGEVSRMQFILFLCAFISDWALIWRRCRKFVSYDGCDGFLGGTWEWFQWSYIICACESTEVDRRTWLHVPSGTHWSTSSDTHQVFEIQNETSTQMLTPLLIGLNQWCGPYAHFGYWTLISDPQPNM